MSQPLSALSVGDKVVEPNSKIFDQPIIWKIADKNHTGYPANSVTLISERSLVMQCFDAKEPTNPNSDRQTYGNNRYLYSNLRQWLNSSAASGEWYTAQHTYDAPPSTANTQAGLNAYDGRAGFLNGFSEEFRSSLMPTTLIVARNTVTDGGGSETVVDKMFLASNTEVGLDNENGVAEGTLLSLFSGGNSSRITQLTTEGIANSNFTSNPANNTTPWYWWLRTPNPDSSRFNRGVYIDGARANSSAYVNSSTVRPLCNLPSTIMVSSSPVDGAYIILWGNEVYANVNGTWREQQAFVKAGGTWREAKAMAKINGEWVG